MWVEFCLTKDYQHPEFGPLDWAKILGVSRNLVKKYPPIQLLSPSASFSSQWKLALNLVNASYIKAQYAGPMLHLLSEDQDVVALAKPPKMHGHPLLYEENQTVLNYVATYGPTHVLAVNPQTAERGILYRLDYETSGLLLMAKNQTFYDRYMQLQQEGNVLKTYRAIVKGTVSPLLGLVRGRFKIIGPKGHKVIFIPSDVGEYETRLTVLDYGKTTSGQPYTYLQIQLPRGHRHHIRAVCAALGHTLWGDPLYEGPPGSRMYLHAYSYEWELDQQKRRFICEVSESFCSFFDKE